MKRTLILGTLFLLMNIRYGSEESLQWVRRIFSVIANAAYSESARLAKKKGTFKLYDKKIVECGFIANSGVLREDVIEDIKKYGLRNASLMAVAPTGNTSILMGVVSNGIEPVFLHEYQRWVLVGGTGATEEEKKIIERCSAGDIPSDWKEEKDQMGHTFYVSPDGRYRWVPEAGLQRKQLVEDYGWKILKRTGVDLKKWNTATALELSVEEHLKVLAAAHRYVDKAISKTVNIPADYPFEEFVRMYERAYDMGIKGLTVYREGTRLGILERKEKKKEAPSYTYICDLYKEHPEGEVIPEGVKVPRDYPAHGYVVYGDGKKWYVHVAFKDTGKKRLFHIFITPSSRYREVSIKTYGVIEELLDLAREKGISENIVTSHIEKIKHDALHNQFARTLSLLFRHNVHIKDIVKVLEEVPAPVNSLIAVIRKFLYSFAYKEGEEVGETCPSCGAQLIFEEGCKRCPQCGWAKCG